MTNTTTAAKKPSKTAALPVRDFALLIGWAFSAKASEAAVKGSIGMRLDALDMLETCSRCGGCGRYSYNQITGDTCFKCNGFGKSLPKLNAKLAEAVKVRVDAGELAPYFAKQAELVASKKMIKPLAEEIKTTLQPVFDAYTASSKNNRGMSWEADREATHAFVESPMFHVNHMAITLYYGTTSRKGPSGPSQMSVSELERGIQFGELRNPLEVEAQMRWLLEAAKVVRAAFEAGAPNRPAGFVSAFLGLVTPESRPVDLFRPACFSFLTDRSGKRKVYSR